LLFNSFENSLDVCGCGLNIGEFESFIGLDLIEDNFLEMGVGDEHRDAVLGQGVNIGIVNCSQSARCGRIEDDVLCILFLLDVILQAEVSLLHVDLVSVELRNLLLEFRI
jgi:hypothetical protein